MRPKRPTGPKLGELLANRGKLDREALLRALRLQRSAGGRIGTALLELGAVAEADLLHVLSEQLGVPFVEPDDLRSIPTEVIQLVPEKVARRRCAIPIRASGTQLSVALLDPRDLAALDELSFVSGRRVRPHIATEARIHEALARYYHVDVDTRFVKLVDRLNRSRFMWGDAEEPETASPTELRHPATPPPHLSVYGAPTAPFPAAAEVRTRAALHDDSPPSPDPPPATPPTPLPPLPIGEAAPPRVEARATAALPPLGAAAPASRSSAAEAPALDFPAAIQRLQQPADRDDIAEVLLGYARGLARPALLVVLRRDEASSWAARGLPQGAVDDLSVPLSSPSVLHALRDGAPLHRGPLSELQGNAPLHRLFPGVEDLLVLPLRVRERVVAAIFVPIDSPPVEPRTLDELRQLVDKASAALAWLILRHKKSQPS